MGANLYMYTEGNPIKFRDPSGMSKTGDFWSNVRKDMTKGFSDAFRSAAKAGDYRNFTLKNAAGGIGWAGKNSKREDALKIAAIFSASGLTPEAFLALYFGMKEKTASTWFGHNYSGSAGNHDPFYSHFTDWNGFMKKLFFLTFILNNYSNINIDEKQKLGFLILVSAGYLSPKPVSFADSLSQRHDREWGHPWEANNNAVTGYIRGIGTREFWEKPVDSILVGGFGLVLLGGSNILWGLPGGAIAAYVGWDYYRTRQ